MKSSAWMKLQLLAAFLLLSGCGGGGGSTAPSIQAPYSLSYSTNPAVYTKGSPIPANNPSSSGSPVVSYSVNPSLPTGLSLNSVSGSISGTPSSISGASGYTVTATNSGGSTSTTLMITVNDVPPSGLSYTVSSATYTKGVAIAANIPTTSGGPVVSYNVSPALPAGLTLSTTLGIISGTPSAVVGTTAYTVTATNSGGSASTTLMITINDVAPTDLAYGVNNAIYTRGSAIIANLPSNNGGTVVSYSVSPALPVGLNIDSQSGIISGTPTVISAAANYTITAVNTGGIATTIISISIIPEPVITNFSASKTIVTEGMLSILSYSFSGGTASINQGIGSVVSGTRNVYPWVTTTYTLTVTNAAGASTSSSVTIVAVPRPTISSFTASPTSISPGGGTRLSATFTGGTSSVSPGGLSIASGGSLDVSGINNSTKFTLTVTNSAGYAVTSSLSVLVFTSTTSSGVLNTPRSGHTSTLLRSGKILITGGFCSASGRLSSAELYDPVTGLFVSTGSMNTVRDHHAAVMLQDGKVLILGGLGSSSDNNLSSSELYDPATGLFTSAGNMSVGRMSPTATLLPNGKVLVAGGQINGSTVWATAELFDPTTGNFTNTGSMGKGRQGHAATLLTNGKVLISGGFTNSGEVATAEIYDVSAGGFSPTGVMSSARRQHTSTLLPSGMVLITGGASNGTTILASADLYDPVLGTFSPTGAMSSARIGHSAVLLPNGKTLVIGGNSGGNPSVTDLMEAYDATLGLFSSIGSTAAARTGLTANLLHNGNILIAGGWDSQSYVGISELYTPADTAPGYPNPYFDSSIYIFKAGLPVTTITPTAGGATGWSIAPALPSGLVLSNSTGSITGTPSSSVPAKAYQISASNGVYISKIYIWITVEP